MGLAPRAWHRMGLNKFMLHGRKEGRIERRRARRTGAGGRDQPAPSSAHCRYLTLTHPPYPISHFAALTTPPLSAVSPVWSGPVLTPLPEPSALAVGHSAATTPVPPAGAPLSCFQKENKASSLVIPSPKNPTDDLQTQLSHQSSRSAHKSGAGPHLPPAALKPRPPETSGGRRSRCFCLQNTYFVPGCKLVQTHSSPQMCFVGLTGV